MSINIWAKYNDKYSRIFGNTVLMGRMLINHYASSEGGRVTGGLGRHFTSWVRVREMLHFMG